MANKKITDVDIVSNVTDDDCLFINQGTAIKQIKKTIIFKSLIDSINSLTNSLKDKLDKNCGTSNANKVLKVGNDGNITYVTMPTGTSNFSGDYNDLTNKPTLLTEDKVNELIDARMPSSAENVRY